MDAFGFDRTGFDCFFRLFEDGIELGETLLGEEIVSGQKIMRPRTALGTVGVLGGLLGVVGNAVQGVEVTLDHGRRLSERRAILLLDRLERKSGTGVLESRDGVEREPLSGIHPGERVVVAAGERMRLREEETLVEIAVVGYGKTVTVQRVVRADHQIDARLVPAIPIVDIPVDLIVGPREIHLRAIAKLEAGTQKHVFWRRCAVGIYQPRELRILFRSDAIGFRHDRLVEFDLAVAHVAEFLDPLGIALVETGLGFCPADLGGDGRMVIGHAVIADALQVAVVALEVDARFGGVVVVEPVLDHLPPEGRRAGAHADEVRHPAPIQRRGAAGAVGQQIEELGMGFEVFFRPRLERMGIILLRKIAVAAVAQQPLDLVIHEMRVCGTGRPLCVEAPQLPPEEEAELRTHLPLPVLELETPRLGDAFAEFSGPEPVAAVVVFEDVVQREERGAGLYE